MTVTLLGATEIRRLAAELDVTPTKKLGQNFVVDANTVRKIVHAADVQPGERVVEIGPGLGSLTLAILEAGAAVTAVEIDHRLAERLPQTALERGVPEGALTVVDADAPLHEAAVPHAVAMTFGGTLVGLAHLANLRLNHGHVHDATCAH